LLLINEIQVDDGVVQVPMVQGISLPLNPLAADFRG